MNDCIVVLDNLRGTFNVGAIFRTADAVGIKKIYVSGITPLPTHPKVQKTALGAERYVAWEKVGRTLPLLKKLNQQGFIIAAIEHNRHSRPYHRWNPSKKPIALIVGNEINGISKQALAYTDVILEIPMHGRKESLNAAIAFGIVSYALKFRA